MEKHEKVQKIVDKHECAFPSEADIIVTYIDNGWFVNTRRWLKKLTTVSPKNPKTKEFLRSKVKIKEEKARHLQYYYYMIHPFSMWRTYWEFLMLFVLLALLVFIPIVISIKTIAFRVPKAILSVLCCVDIAMNFATGYYHANTKRIILDPKKVTKNYIKGYFFIDLLSSVPFVYGAVDFLKLLRIITLLKYMDNFRDWKQYSIVKFKIVKLLVVYLVIILWTTMSVLMISRLNNNRWRGPNKNPTATVAFIYSCYKAILMLFMIASADNMTRDLGECIFQMICMTFGKVMSIYILAQILHLLINFNSTANNYNRLVDQLNQYMQYRMLSEPLKRRIVEYLEFKFQKHYYKISEIFETMPISMQKEIILYTSKKLVEKAESFKNLPTTLLVNIVTYLKSEIYLPNDVIVHGGVSGDSMYFIMSGTVAVYTVLGKELCHLSDGAHFGEIALVMPDERRTASVVAVDCCEIYCLKREDFQHAIEPYPDLLYRIRQLAQMRYQYTKREEKDQQETAGYSGGNWD